MLSRLLLLFFLVNLRSFSFSEEEQDIMDLDLDGDIGMKATDDEPASRTNDAVSDDPYKSSSFIGHSLWLIPTGDSKVAYETIVGEKASELGTFSFKPHITLVAAIMTDVADVVARTKALAEKLTPYEFEFDTVSQKDAYFQCVFAKFQRTKQAVDANALAREYFPEKKTDPEYMPHLSLVYGDFTLEEKESKLIPELKAMIVSRTPDATSFKVDAIEVWSTQGDVKDWYLVETIPMKGPLAAANKKEETCPSDVAEHTAGPLAKFRRRILRLFAKLRHILSVTRPSK